MASTNCVGHKTRVHLNNKQASWMLANCNAGRFAYNYAVAFMRDTYFFPSYMDIRKYWSHERDDLFPWMKKERLCMAAINNAINTNFKNAIKNWKDSGWDRDNAPKFHGKSYKKSITMDYTVIKDNHISGRTIKLPSKMGTVRLGEPPRFHGKIKKITFSHEGGKWYVSFLIATDNMPKPDPAPQGTKIGVDVGVAQFASLSNGQQYKGHTALGDHEDRLKREQRKLSRMDGPIRGQKKASRNWLRQKVVVAKLMRKISNVRKNYIEHVTLDIANTYSTVAIEDLKIKNMTGSAKGDADKPGKNVAAKAGLNKSLLNNALYTFRSKLEHKVGARQGTVIAVNPAYTSQTCSGCGHVSKDNRKSQAEFLCVECGHAENADVNAAKNILSKAM